MNNKKIDNLSFREISEVRKKLCERADYYEISLVDIAKHFFNFFAAVDFFDLEYKQVRSVYTGLLSKEDKAPVLEDEFYAYVVKTHLGLIYEPRQVFVETMLKVVADLNKIDSNLLFIAAERTRLEDESRKNGRLDGEQRYYKNQLDFYKERNNAAKREIVEFVSGRAKDYVNNYASRSYFRKFWPTALPYPYASLAVFSKFIDIYDVQKLNNMSNKFLELSMSNKIAIEKLHKQDPAAFFSFAKNYIEQSRGTLELIRGHLAESHILNRRKNTIETLLRHYVSGDYLSFVNMAPLQIEGIFHDICLEVGFKQADLDISSINDKLKKLDTVFGYSLNYEYYAFKFPVLRNAVAHGELVEDGVEHAAIMLMLDLGPVCELTLDHHIPLNTSIKLVREFVTSKDFNILMTWLPYQNIEIPNFYNLEDSVALIRNAYESDEFWAYISEELKSVTDFNDSPLINFIAEMRRLKIAVSKCKDALASIKSIKKSASEKDLEVRTELIQNFLDKDK